MKLITLVDNNMVKYGLAGVVELVDTLDLGSSIVRCESSSLSFRTNYNLIYLGDIKCLKKNLKELNRM